MTGFYVWQEPHGTVWQPNRDPAQQYRQALEFFQSHVDRMLAAASAQAKKKGDNGNYLRIRSEAFALLIKQALRQRESCENRGLKRAGAEVRSVEGRRRAKARGVRLGRPLALNTYQRQEALARRQAGET
jgi:hypothetical protein